MAIVEITGWQVGFNKVACTRIVRAAAGLDLADGKQVTDGVLAGKVQRVSVPSGETASRLAHELTEIGAIASAIADSGDE
jgi:ribosomal protein L7/L12